MALYQIGFGLCHIALLDLDLRKALMFHISCAIL